MSRAPGTASTTPGPPGLPELVRIEDIAKALGITERHVRRLVDERRIPFVKVGFFIRFEPAQVARWVASQRVEPPGPARHARRR